MTDLNALADRLGIDRAKAAVLLQVVKSTHPLFLRVADEWPSSPTKSCDTPKNQSSPPG